MKQDKQWFSEWFDENYLDVYRHRNSEEAMRHVQLIIDTLNLPKTSVILDLCCGEGRHTVIFKNLGYKIMGLDLSETMIRCAKCADPELNLVIGDMRQIPGQFDLILSLFTSFGYFETDAENGQVIRSVFNALNRAGIFWLDFFNSEKLKGSLVSESHLVISPTVEVVEKRKIEKGRIIKDIYLTREGVEKSDKYYRESVRLYSRNDLERMFIDAGFQITYIFGDYSGNPWAPDSDRSIIVGRK